MTEILLTLSLCQNNIILWVHQSFGIKTFPTQLCNHYAHWSAELNWLTVVIYGNNIQWKYADVKRWQTVDWRWMGVEFTEMWKCHWRNLCLERVEGITWYLWQQKWQGGYLHKFNERNFQGHYLEFHIVLTLMEWATAWAIFIKAGDPRLCLQSTHITVAFAPAKCFLFNF